MTTVTDTQRTRLLTNIGDNVDDPSLTEDEITDLFTQSEEAGYTDARTIMAFVTVTAIEWLMAKASTDVSYTQNQTTEQASDRYKNLERLHGLWANKLETSSREASGGMLRWGAPRKKPTRVEEYPDA